MKTACFSMILALLSVELRAEEVGARVSRSPIEWFPVVKLTNAGPQRGYRVRTWTTSSGLPMNMVQCLLQARNGLLWIGTQGGLAKFDGREFTPFHSRNTPAFRKNSCLSLAEGLDGTIWIGTVSGIVCYRSNRFEHIPVPHQIGDGEWVPGIAVAPSGAVWAATRQGPGTVSDGRFIFDPTYANGIPNSLPSNETHAIQVDRAGNVLVSGYGCLRRRMAHTNGWELLNAKPTLKMFLAGDGTVWAVDPVLCQISNGIPVHYQPSVEDSSIGFSAATVDRRGRVYVALQNSVFALDDGLRKLVLSRGLPGEVKVLLADQEGNLWAGTTAGLACLSPMAFRSLTPTNGLVHHDAWSVVEADDGSIMIGTSGGITRLMSGTIENYVAMPRGRDAVQSTQVVFKLSDGRVWAVSDGYLCQVFPFQDAFPERMSWPERYAIPRFQDVDGAIWLEVPHTAVRTWAQGRFSAWLNLGAGMCGGLRDSSGRLWIGTSGAGLLVIEGTRTNRLTTADGLTSNYCGPALADSDGAVWIVSDHGLNRWKDGAIRQFTVDDGLPEDVVLNLLEDDLGWFWLNGHRGIHRVRRRDLCDFADGRSARFTVVSYSEEDGIPNSEGNGGWLPNSCKARDGSLWFPTIGGIAIVNPAELSAGSKPPPPIVTRIISNGEVLYGDGVGLADLTRPLQLAPGGGDDLRIHYTCPTFGHDAQVRFHYRLEQQNSDWMDAGDERFALYTNLRPGTYRLRIKAVNRHGLGSESAAVDFHIAPHYFETWFFYAFCAAAVAGVVASFHGYRMIIQRRILRLEQQNAIERERSRIAADIHDVLGADLSRISMTSERLRESRAFDDSAIGVIAETVRGMGGNLSELIWATNSRNDTLDHLLSYLRAYVARTCESAGIRLVADIPNVPSLAVSGFVRHQVFLIIREALNNAVKHARASEIQLRVVLGAQALEICLRDDGCGFASDDASLWSNGQVNLRKRAADIQSELVISSRGGSGTSVCLRVPMRVIQSMP